MAVALLVLLVLVDLGGVLVYVLVGSAGCVAGLGQLPVSGTGSGPPSGNLPWVSGLLAAGEACGMPCELPGEGLCQPVCSFAPPVTQDDLGCAEVSVPSWLGCSSVAGLLPSV